MVKNYTSLSFALFLSVVGTKSLSANTGLLFRSENLFSTMRRDTVTTDKPDSSLKTDTIGQMVKSLQKFKHVRDTVDVRKVSLQPNLSLQQIVKGQLASVYVQEPSGEPGSVQSMIVQGASGVMFTKRDNYALQPAVYLNGVPMVQENPFAFDVQEYEYNRIGPATNLLSQIDMSNIQSIAVIKDPFELAKLGPNAANGAIYITTKNARAGVKDISLNAYYGFASTPKVYTTNGAYENAFRKQFFDKYATQQNYDDYAPYLRDSTNTAFFGPSNWNDLYYKNTPTYSADLGITGGNDRANFRFFGSGTKNANSADETSINRYNIFFGINMAPFKWLTVSSNVNAARLDRFGNRSLRDRYAEARYIPDLSTPLSPNAAVYGAYLQEFDKSVDNNRVTTLNGNLTLSAKIDKLTLTTSLLFDYNEGSRDYFTPSTLMDGISYISSYFGYNQRMIWNNAASYKFDFTPKSELQLEAGQTYQEDTYKYNYTRAYDGPSDFVKLNKVSATATGDDYLNSSAFGQVFRYIDKEANGLFSVYGSAKFKYEDLLTFSALVRRDGSSNGQPDNRWVTTPAFDVKYSLKNQFLKSNSTVNSLNFAAGWGQTVRTFLDDRYAAGPQYRTENGWDEEPTIPGYGPVLGMNRPYNSGFIGYNIKMPIAERTNINLDGSFFNNRLNASLTAYNRNDKNQLIGVPVSQESGYTQNYKSGLEVNNKGLELLLNASIIPQSKKIGWNTSANVNYNKNKVTALPDGYQDLISGENKIAVGKSIGSYWLYTNRGSYENESQIPTGMTFNGIPLKVGDPIWKDYNNDNRIDNKDKVMQGDRLPQFSGGWTNTLSYLKFDLTFNLVYAVGQKALNQYDSNRYGFINREASNDINSIREVSSWQRYDNEKSYTIYNPWSDVDPYRVDQDLFLEDASYLKLRSVTLGYDLTKAAFLSKSLAKIRRFYVYATAQNLWTLTNFSGADPELINYTGYYDGANISMPKTFVLGFKLDL